MQHSILITGAAGAGKTTLAAHLARQIGAAAMLSAGGQATSQAIDARVLERGGIEVLRPSDRRTDAVIEHCAYGSGWQGVVGILIVVIDAVRFAGGRGATMDAEVHVLRTADLVVLARTDLVDATDAFDLLSGMTEAPVHAAVFGELDATLLPAEHVRQVSLPSGEPLTCWGYSGNAQLDAALCEALLKRRPKGVERIKGEVLAGESGLRLDQVGRARSVTPCAAPQESHLFAAGTRGVFRQHHMDVHFAETVASGAATSGWFGFR